jgi:lysophospholipase L1-like esterase
MSLRGVALALLLVATGVLPQANAGATIADGADGADVADVADVADAADAVAGTAGATEATGATRQGDKSDAAGTSESRGVRLILVGDSTLATRNGYGDALCGHFRSSVTCVNMAKNGRSSGSYRAEGSWREVLSRLSDGKSYRATYVMIEFGHNDQPGKPGRSTDLATEFPANIARYADEVIAAGAIPILVTPLTRRTFDGAALKNDLNPWAEATRRVAREKQLALIDLYAESFAAVQAMGQKQADTLALPPPDFDRTHLGPTGAVYFADLVARLLPGAIPDLAPHLHPEVTHP